ncbi:MAG: hypothetical protein IBJ11_09855 [Phycisphaerales bacterium]|nr:hypothetical protein [Phycisphaerales bacterium]
MPRMFPPVLTCLVLALFLANPAHAGFRKPNVLLAAADISANTADVKAKLDALGVFGTVTVRDLLAPNVTPTLAELRAFDAVMVWSNSQFADSVALGNVMADYVDAGGGVVSAVFESSSVSAGYFLAGRWASGGYRLVQPVGGDAISGPVQTLAAISPSNNNDLLVNGVKALNGGSSSYRPRPTSILAAGAFAVANWSDGTLLAAASTTLPGRVDLGMFPPSAAVDARLWNPATDGARLMANALLRTIRPRVLLVAADGSGAFPPDVVAKLRSTDKIGIVDTFAAQTATPTLATLLTYDAALVYSNLPFSDPGALGDVLADYTDRGGGVVVGMFATGAPGASGFPAGRFALQGYALTSPTGGRTTGSAATLGAVAYPNHPIMAGVASFNGGTASPRPTSTAVPGHATVIANWSDGKLLAVTSTRFPNRADLGFFPPSNTVSGGLWDAATDGAKLLANTVEYVVKPYVAQVFSSSTAAFTADVTGKLAGLRRFSAVDAIPANASTPTAAALRPYSGLLVWCDNPFANAASLGNTLAAYVDLGGGVVVTSASNSGISGVTLAGAWVPSYEVIPSAGGGPLTFVNGDVGTRFIPTHPILRGVARMPLVSGPFITQTAVTGPRLANFDNGKTLAAVSSTKRRADLGMPPISTAGLSNGYDTRTDGATLVANALEWVIATTPCPGDIDGNGTVGANDLSNLLACFGLAVTPGPCAAADLDGNGTIGANDLSILLANFGAACKR